MPGGGGTYRDPEFVHNGQPQPHSGIQDGCRRRFRPRVPGQQNNGHTVFLLVPFYAPHTPYDYQPDAYRKLLPRLHVPLFPR